MLCIRRSAATQIIDGVICLKTLMAVCLLLVRLLCVLIVCGVGGGVVVLGVSCVIRLGYSSSISSVIISYSSMMSAWLCTGCRFSGD